MYNLPADGAQAEQPVSLRTILAVLFKRKRIIISLFASIVGAVTLVSFILPRVYSASAKAMVERELDSEKALLFRVSLPTEYENQDWINSELEIIKSHPVAVRVVEALKLDDNGVKADSSNEAGRTARLEKAIKKFNKQLSVKNLGKSSVIEVSYEHTDPRLAAAVANNVVETYVNYRSELFNESSSYKFFEEQMHLADEKLRGLEQKQADFKQSQEVLSPQEQKGILLAKLADYEKSLTTVRTQRIGQEAKLAVIKAQVKKGNHINIPATAASDSPSREKFIAKLKSDLLDLELQREKLLQKFTPQYEEVVNLEKQIAATKAKIATEIKEIVNMEGTFIRALKAEEGALQTAIDSINSEIKGFAHKEYEYSQLSRGIEDNREVYSMLLKQREDARISLAKLENGIKIRVINPAVIPIEPVKPRRTINVALAVLLGLMSGLGLAFLFEYFDHSINNPVDFEKYTGLKFLGSVREIQIARPRGKAFRGTQTPD